MRKNIFPLFLLLYHLAFSWFGWKYLLENNGDAKKYWLININIEQHDWSDFLHPGTDIVRWITFPLVKYLEMPFWSGFLLFSSISGWGIFLLYRMLQKITEDSTLLYLLALLLLLLPNLHFWTSLIGKETLLLPALVVFINEFQKKKIGSLYLFLSLLLIALIRPHVAFILLLANILSLLVTGKFSLTIRIWLVTGFIFLTGFFTWILLHVQDFSGGIPRVIRKYEAHIRFFKKTDAYVPLDEYHLPYKIFTFYFRPLPFEKTGILYQVVSLENAVLLLLSGVALFFGLRYFQELRKNRLVVFSFLFIILMAAMYVYAYANYGIIMRTKIMAAPFFYVLIMEILKFRCMKKFR